jgi:streptogramin lyase
MRRIGGSIRAARLTVIVSMAVAALASSGMVGAPAFGAMSSGSLLGSPLVVPAAESFLGGQLQAAAIAAKRANPAAVAARVRSRTAFAHLSAARVGRLLSHAFPDVINHPSGGTPPLPAGAHLVGYPTANAIQLSLPGDRLGILESNSPVAKRTSDGRFSPINLALTTTASGFAPANSTVAVSIPRVLSAGVGTPQNHVSLTPVNRRGHGFKGARGGVVGSSVVYPNTQPATDTVVKPTPTGFQIDVALRSTRSPRQLFFNVHAPAGFTLGQDRRSRVVRVMRHGAKLATILPPGAIDAAGTSVPASMRVAGRRIVVTVEHRSGSYLYPIEVDPEINDNQLAETSGGKRSNWAFGTSSESKFGHKAVYEGSGKEHLETTGIAEYKASEFAYWAYETKGNSKLYELKTKTSAKNKLAKIESFLEFRNSGGAESKKLLSTEGSEPEYTEKASTICAWNASKVEECLPASGKEKNVIRFQQSATASPGSNFKFSDTMSEGIVSISEPSGEHSTTSYNTTSPEVEGEVEEEGKKVIQKRVNALYGAGIWITKSIGALQLIAKDPGIGVSATRLEYEKSAGSWETLSSHNYLENEKACQGVQCYAEHTEYWTLDPKLPDGEDKIRYRAEEAISGTVSLTSEGEKTIKVDAGKPHRLNLEGLPWGNELSEKPYELTGEATDGEGSTVASSGIKSIALYIDGSQFGTAGGSCSVAKGECTATDKWTVNGSELGAGHHAIQLVVFDNAGNEARIAESLSIRHSTPVALGPGSVDLQSGDFALSAADVSLGSGLNVGRNYSSRDLTQGEEGPLGPQWSLGLSSTDSLVELVDGSLLLRAANGSQSIFAEVGAHKFEGPNGDSNLQITLEENETTKQKLAYYLEDLAKHTKTKFTRPTASVKAWVPTKQEGTVATDTLSYTYQTVDRAGESIETTGYTPPASNVLGITQGADGNLWYTDDAYESKIGKITTSGSPTEYSVPAGSTAYGIAEGPDGNLWYTNYNSQKIGKITKSGTIKEYSLPANSFPTGITAGPDGKMWFTDDGWNGAGSKIGKITTEGTITEYALPSGSGAYAITQGPDGNLWFTNDDPFHGNKIGKITTSGSITEYSLPSGSHPLYITQGPDGNLWYTEYATSSKIGKITTSGSITEYSLPSSSFPAGITQGRDGDLWFVDYKTGKAGKITTSGSVTEFALPSGSEPYGLTLGPDGDLWYTEYNKGIESGKIGKVRTPNTITDPTQALAPVPAGVSCAPELKAGCRALKFTYATKTTATGEAQSEWGEYNQRLMKVLADVYEPTSKAMQETAVAEYSYDAQGRLRAEWDPRISPALKTLYGYDEEGHVTAMDPPGAEPWAFTYGTSAGDVGTGRLLKVTRSSASTELWGGGHVTNTAAPTISGTAAPGKRLAVSDGTWSEAITVYGYRWERCNSALEACKEIEGATNANYTPTAGDVGYKLVAKVTATNGGGSVAVRSGGTAIVKELVLTDYTLGGATGYQFWPEGIAAGSDGNLWISNSSLEGGDEFAKVTTSGTVTEYGSGQLKGSSWITAGPSGNLWYTWYTNTPGIGKLTTGGTTTKYTSNSGCNEGITEGPDGNLWFAQSCSSKIAKSTPSGEMTYYSLPEKAHPFWITKGPDGALWFTEVDTYKIGRITTGGEITEYSLPAHERPYGIVAGPDGKLWFTIRSDTTGASAIGKITTGGTITEYALSEWESPYIITEGPDGALWFTENGLDRVGRITTSGTVAYRAMSSGSKPYGIVTGPDGNLWVTDHANSKVTKFNPETVTEGEQRSPQPGYTIEYGVPLAGGSGLPTMTSSQVAKWGQTDVPVEATSIFPPDEPQSWPAAGYKRAITYYLDENGREVNVSSPGTATNGSVTTTEYNELNDAVRTLTADNRLTALEAGSKSVEVAKLLDTESTYNLEGEAPGTQLIDVLGPQHQIKYMVGKEQKESLARHHLKYFYNEGAPGGEKYDLVTRTTDLAQLANEEEVEVRHTTNSYSGQSNLGWKLRAPTSVTADSEGAKLTTTTLYNSTTGQITETRSPAGSGGGTAHDMKLIYYSAEANTEGYTTCGSHPEWTGLLCETLPAKQPSVGAKLPVAVVTYNMWNEPSVTTETFGSTVRTKKETYDSAGRLTGSETTSTTNTALPKVTNEYSSTLGVLEKQSTTVEGTTKTVTSKYDKLGEMTEYIDADGNTTKYTYGTPANDSLLEEMTDGSNGGSGRQIYSYNATTKLLEKVWDSAAGTFTATYDPEGNLASEVYPNAMCANYTRNSVGVPTQIQYIKTSNCSESSPTVWYTEARLQSVRGETFSRSSTLSNDKYAYDTAGRLTETQETPAGKGCNVRLYGYDEESNRTSQTSRVPGGGGACATEGGTVLNHTYDEANRLTDSGIEYDTFGNVTKLPAADAEGHELSSTFYVDNAVATQSQNGVSTSYYLDPTGRVRETVSGGNKVISHYDAPGEGVVWTSETGGKSTRNIPGIDGGLASTQTNGETPVLQLHDLEGSVVATASLSAEATSLLSTYDSTEFGVPNAEKTPPKFAWLGAEAIATALPSGVITYGSTSYVPQTGRALQSEAVDPPGGAPGGTGAGAAYTSQEEPWVFQGAGVEAAEAPGLEAARELAAEEAAVSAALAAGGEDPTLYFLQKKAVEIGKKLNNLKTWGEIWDAIFGIMGLADPLAWLEGAVIGVISLDVMEQWLHNTGGKLEQCGKNRENWVELCKLKYDTILKGTFVDPFVTSEVEKCGTYLWYQKYMAKTAWECRRLGEKPVPV